MFQFGAWGVDFTPPSQEEHPLKETLQESTLSKEGHVCSGLVALGWIQSTLAESTPHKTDPPGIDPNIGDPPMVRPGGFGVGGWWVDLKPQS